MNCLDIDKNFFGRSDILGLLQKRVINLKDGYRQNIALLGHQHIGKSSVLYNFLTRLNDPDVTIIYLDLENKDFNYFFSKFSGSLLYNFSKNQGLPLHQDLNLLLEHTKHTIPHTCEVIKKIRQDLSKGKTLDSFLGLLSLPEIFTNETGKFCVLILDEFQNLEDFSIPNVFQELGQKIMTQKKCFYIVSSSFPITAKKILSEKLSLLFGGFEVIHVELFDASMSHDFIIHNLQNIKIGHQLRQFLADFTGGHPLYLTLICQELINLSAIHKQSEIYLPLLSQAIENAIFDRWGVISRHFDLIIENLCNGKGNRLYSSLLISLSNGNSKVIDVVNDIDVKKTNVTSKMNRLIELGIIAKNGNVFYFKDKLFKYWVKFVYQKRLKDVELVPEARKMQFKEEFNESVENFKKSSRQDFSSRIIELLHCFDNEAFDLNGRKYKLPQFVEIELDKLTTSRCIPLDVVKAATSDNIWLIVIKKENLGENELNVVLSEYKKIQKKPERCLLISLTGLDENARIKALQERFWIWNEGELNMLLTLFDKPYIS